jgi:hypothetical protein
MSGQERLTNQIAARSPGDPSIAPPRRRLSARHELAVIQAEIRRMSRTAAARRSELPTRTPGTNRA